MVKICKFGLGYLFLLAMAAPAWANISIFPYSVDFEANSNKRVQTVRVINISEKDQVYRVSFVNFLQDNSGKYTEVDNEDGPFARKYLVSSPRQFHLKPHEMQTINIARRGLSELPDGEYVSHLKIQEVKLGGDTKEKTTNDNLVSISLRPLFAVTIPVTIEKGNNLVSKTEILGYRKVSADTLEVTLKRLGNKSSRVNIVIEDIKGNEIGRLNSVKIYTTNDKLTSKVVLKDSSANSVILKIEDAKTKENILQQKINI